MLRHILFVPPARPGESRCPGGVGRRGNRARWPLPVTMIAVTGAVKAVTGAVIGAVKTVTGAVKAVTGAVTAVSRGRDPRAGRDRHRAAVPRRQVVPR